jgi:hypothetical protein
LNLNEDCRLFITTQLWSAYTNVANIMDLKLVPHGKKRIRILEES